ncbi:MAG: hypothetical protein AAF433_03130 [Bacteroidota bacterium]
MPKVLHLNCFDPGELGLWRIEESEDWLRRETDLYPSEIEQLNQIKGEGRRCEFLAARLLLHQLSGRQRRGALIKDDFGKPRLESSNWHISISHTSGFSAAYAHPKACGVDVQILVPKISRLAPKFINETEAANLRTEEPAILLMQQHLVWGAKEVIYKAYGRRQLDFKQHLTVDLASATAGQGQLKAYLLKDDLLINYRLDYRVLEGKYMLVIGVEG